MRPFRKMLVSALAIPLFATPLVATAQQADAATTCKVGLSGLPSTVTIDATDRRYWVQPTATNCVGIDRSLSWVFADAYGPNTTLKRTYSGIMADFGVKTHVTLWSSDFKAGRYTVLDDDSSIVDGDYNDMHYSWVRKSFTAKYRGLTTLAVKRSGHYVRLSGHVRRYSPTWMDYVGFRHTVSVQRYYSGHWHTIKKLTPTTSSGAFSFSYYHNERATYRAVTVATTTTLGDASAAHTVVAAR